MSGLPPAHPCTGGQSTWENLIFCRDDVAVDFFGALLVSVLASTLKLREYPLGVVVGVTGRLKSQIRHDNETSATCTIHFHVAVDLE